MLYSGRQRVKTHIKRMTLNKISSGRHLNYLEHCVAGVKFEYDTADTPHITWV